MQFFQQPIVPVRGKQQEYIKGLKQNSLTLGTHLLQVVAK
jgi:hypothetical protein